MKSLQITCIAVFAVILVVLSIVLLSTKDAEAGEFTAGEDSRLHAQGITVDGNMPAAVTSGTCAICGKALSATHAYVKITNETDLARVFKNAAAQAYGLTSCYHVTTKLTANATTWGFTPVSLGRTAAAPFQGIFDFGGSTLVTNSATILSAANVYGLFPYLSAAKVYGLNVQNTGTVSSIFFQANNGSIISDCTVQVTHDGVQLSSEGGLGRDLLTQSIVRDCEVTYIHPDTRTDTSESSEELLPEYLYWNYGGILCNNNTGTLERCTVTFTKGRINIMNFGGAVYGNYGYVANVDVIYHDDCIIGYRPQLKTVNGLAFGWAGSNGLAPKELGIQDDYGEPLRYHIYNVHVTYNRTYSASNTSSHSAYWTGEGIFGGAVHSNSTAEHPLVMQYCSAMGNYANFEDDITGAYRNGIRGGGTFFGMAIGSADLYACMTYIKEGFDNPSGMVGGGGFMGSAYYYSAAAAQNNDFRFRRCYLIAGAVRSNHTAGGFIFDSNCNVDVEECGIYLNTFGPCRNDTFYVTGSGGAAENIVRAVNNQFFAMNRVTNNTVYFARATGSAAKYIFTGNEYVNMQGGNNQVGYAAFGNAESVATDNTVLNSADERAIAQRIVNEMIANPPNMRRAWSDPDKTKDILKRTVGIDASKQEATCTLTFDKTEFAGATVEGLYVSVNGTGFGAYTQLVSDGKVVASKEMGKAFGTAIDKISNSFNQITFTYVSPQTDVTKIVIKVVIKKADGTSASYYVLQDNVVMI